MNILVPGLTANDRLIDELRPRAFAISYRMLGSVGDAGSC